MWIYLMILSTALGGLAVIIQKLALHTLNTEVVAWFRSAIIFLTITLFIFFQKKTTFTGLHLEAKQIFYLVLMGLLSAAVLLLYLYALKSGKASLVGGIDNLTFVFTALFAFIILGESLTVFSVAGILMILGGVFLMTL